MAGNVHGGVRVVFSAAAAAVGDDVYTEIRYGHESSHHPLLQKPVWTSESSSHSLENLRPGDHIWCHARGYKNVIQHHGIYDGTGGVYHFDTVQVGKNGDRYKVDREYIYKNCDACSSRLTQREEAGLPSTGVRFNCLRCFAHGKNVYRCEYEASIAGLVWRATGSRSTRVCKWSGEDVVRRAKWFFEHDQFGKYEVMTCNCEDFARWCKIGELGSKQVTRAEVLAGVLEVSVVGSSLTYVSLSRCRKRHEHKLKKLEIEYSLVQEIEASAVVITETMSGLRIESGRAHRQRARLAAQVSQLKFLSASLRIPSKKLQSGNLWRSKPLFHFGMGKCTRVHLCSGDFVWAAVGSCFKNLSDQRALDDIPQEPSSVEAHPFGRNQV